MNQEQHRGTYHFADATFHMASGRLTRDGSIVRLRPTTARLLGVFLTVAADDPAQIQSKDMLIAAVWPRGQASEQSLFQAISELRRALAPEDALVTVPNQGYRFALSVTRAGERSWPRLSMVASVALMAIVALVGQGGPTPDVAQGASVSPSLSAFARGVALLENDEPARAEAVFRAVLLETPSFADARVLLGEAMLAQGRLDDARDYATSLLAESRELDPLSGVSALALMSRAQERAGRTGEALHWALVAAERAQREALSCAAAEIDDRIAALMETRPPSGDARSSPWPVATPHDASVRSGRDPAAEPQERPARCAQLRAPTPMPEAREIGMRHAVPVRTARTLRREAIFKSTV